MANIPPSRAPDGGGLARGEQLALLYIVLFNGAPRDRHGQLYGERR